MPVSTTVIGLAGVSVSLGDADGVSIQDGQGALILFGGTGTGAGVAGTFSGTHLGRRRGSLGRRQRRGAVQQHRPQRSTRWSTVGGTEIPVHFVHRRDLREPDGGASRSCRSRGKGSIKIGDFIELVGGFSHRGRGITITDGILFVGQGPRELDDHSPNPNAKGLLITGVNATDRHRTAGSTPTGTVSLIGIPGLTFTGTVRVKGTKGATGAGSSVVAGNLVLGVGRASRWTAASSFGYTAATPTEPGKLTISVGTGRHRPADRPSPPAAAQAQHGCGHRRRTARSRSRSPPAACASRTAASWPASTPRSTCTCPARADQTFSGRAAAEHHRRPRRPTGIAARTVRVVAARRRRPSR